MDPNIDDNNQSQETPVIEPSQDKLYAGKYKTPEDLEKAYSELQKKLGSRQQPQETPPLNMPQIPPVVESKIDLATIAQEYVEKGGLGEDTLKKMSEVGLTKEYVDVYMDGLRVRANKVLDAVGGKDAFTEMATWASQNLPAEEVADLNKALKGSEKDALKALKALKLDYEEANGKPPAKLVEGGMTPTPGDLFQSIDRLSMLGKTLDL
jgi:hypothetical protein